MLRNLSRFIEGTVLVLFKRSAHSAGPRSFSKQCCLKVASVKLLARWRSHRFFVSRVGTFGCRFRCLLGAFGDPRAALGVAWGSFGGPLGAFFGSLGFLWVPLNPPGRLCRSQGSSLGGPGRPCGLLGRYGGGLQENPGNSRTHFEVILGSFFMIFRYTFGCCFFIDF